MMLSLLAMLFFVFFVVRVATPDPDLVVPEGASLTELVAPVKHLNQFVVTAVKVEEIGLEV